MLLAVRRVKVDWCILIRLKCSGQSIVSQIVSSDYYSQSLVVVSTVITESTGTLLNALSTVLTTTND